MIHQKVERAVPILIIFLHCLAEEDVHNGHLCVVMNEVLLLLQIILCELLEIREAHKVISILFVAILELLERGGLD